LNKILSFSVFASSIAKVQFVAEIRDQVLNNGQLDISMFDDIARMGHCWRTHLRKVALGTDP
jgi:hypothetical protein